MAQWRARYEVLKEKRDGLATELQDVYPPLVAKIADLFSRITANDAELAQLHQARPSGESPHLDGAELTARGLERFTRENPSIASELRLPSFEHSDPTVWPPSRTFDPNLFAPVVSGDPRLSTGDWWKVQPEEAHALREQKAREAAEREARRLENYHGPRWWERQST